MSSNIISDPEISPTTAMQQDTNRLFPIFLKLEDLALLIIGGGNRCMETLREVLQNSPETNVRIVAINISDEIKTLVSHNKKVHLIERPYERADIDDADIIITTINDISTNAQINKDAKSKGMLVSVSHKPELSDFYLGSIMQNGNLKIGISDSDNLSMNTRSKFSTERVKLANSEINETEKPAQKHWKRIAAYSSGAFACMLIGHFVFSYIPLGHISDKAINLYQTLDKNFPWMVLAGFVAQLVDGALGMGYGVTSAAILLSTGINPAAISGSIHTAEMFSSGASGYSHYKFGNVNKKMFKIMVIPGVAGAIGGAMLLVFLGEKYSFYIRPVLAGYTLFLGCKILLNAFRKLSRRKKFKHYGPLAALGGFLDSFGGGGWGPIVTTTLITKGRTPRFVIGTVSLTEFFVTLASAFTFFTLLGVSHWQTIIALIIGGFIAAPIAAKLAGKLPRKAAFILLGILVIVWSLKILSKLL
jgi:uncharacterized protein